MFERVKKNESPLVDFYANDHKHQPVVSFPDWQIGSLESCSGNSAKEKLLPIPSIYNPETPVPFLWDGSD
jgi:hypothetical protein